ncbi:MAG TPA: TlpA disulfide reductase family protein [Bacteroidia bacterium]|nr:TlpA disulfide reductase family protein [Bacteroidia bacterium]HNS13349.1 TlpA disulfide reductase family protein [Bacteroidia bacterium]
MRSLKFSELSKEISEDTVNIQVVNFWATWCKPCIEELPYFEFINEEYASVNIKVKLINLDFNSKVETVTLPFIKKHNLRSDLYHLTDTDPNEWINKIDPSWSGAIPATVIYSSGEKIFFKEGELSQQQLVDEIEKVLKHQKMTE